MKKMKNIHPGEILKEEFIAPLNINSVRLSWDSGLSQSIFSKIIHSKRRITAATALRLSKYFGTSAKFWLGLQNDFDLEEEKRENEREFNLIKHHSITEKS